MSNPLIDMVDKAYLPQFKALIEATYNMTPIKGLEFLQTESAALQKQIIKDLRELGDEFPSSMQGSLLGHKAGCRGPDGGSNLRGI